MTFGRVVDVEGVTVLVLGRVVVGVEVRGFEAVVVVFFLAVEVPGWVVVPPVPGCRVDVEVCGRVVAVLVVGRLVVGVEVRGFEAVVVVVFLAVRVHVVFVVVVEVGVVLVRVEGAGRGRIMGSATFPAFPPQVQPPRPSERAGKPVREHCGGVRVVVVDLVVVVDFVWVLGVGWQVTSAAAALARAFDILEM